MYASWLGSALMCVGKRVTADLQITPRASCAVMYSRCSSPTPGRVDKTPGVMCVEHVSWGTFIKQISIYNISTSIDHSVSRRLPLSCRILIYFMDGMRKRNTNTKSTTAWRAMCQSNGRIFWGVPALNIINNFFGRILRQSHKDYPHTDTYAYTRCILK